jgi:hypothetical protein
MTSVLNVDTIADKAGTGPVALTKQQAAKCASAHGTDAVLDSGFNVSSITDSGTGVFDTNYTNNFSAATNVYSSTRFGTTTVGFTYIDAHSTSSHTVDTTGHAGGFQDKPCSSTVHGDLA